MKLQCVELTLERALSLVKADPGLEVSRPVRLEESGEVLLREGEKLTLETMNRVRTSGVKKLLVRRTDRRWIHPEEGQRDFSELPVEDEFELPTGDDPGSDPTGEPVPYNKFLDILSHTSSPLVLNVIGEHVLPAGEDSSPSGSERSGHELREELENLHTEYQTLRSGLEELGETPDRTDGTRFLEGRLVGIEPLEMDLSLPEKWLFRLQNYVQKRRELCRRLETEIEEREKKRRYLDRQSSSTETGGESDPFKSFTAALERVEEQDHPGAIDALIRWAKQGSDPGEKTLSRLKRLREALSAHAGGERQRLLEQIFEETEADQHREDLLGMIGEEDPPPLDRLIAPPASPRLCRRIDQYRLRQLRLHARAHRELRRGFSSLSGDVSGEKKTRLLSRLEEPFNERPPDELFPRGYLYLPRSDEDQTGEERERERLGNQSVDGLCARSSMGRETVESLLETYEVPDDLDKWPREIIRRLEAVLLELLFPANVNMDRVIALNKRLKEIITAQPKPYQLLVQPPVPERYLLVHTYNVTVVSQMIGLELGLMDYQRTQLLLGSLYLDAGMGVVPSSLYLNGGELSSRGLKQVRRHAAFSRQMAARGFGPLHTVARIVHESHERVDGSGYPGGKSREDLHPLTPILSAADVYASLQEARTHRDRHSPEGGLQTMLGEREKYDPLVLETLLKTPGLYPNGTVVLLSDNRLGLVQRQDPLDPRGPCLLMLTDAEQNKLSDLEKLRLVEHPELRILRSLRY